MAMHRLDPAPETTVDVYSPGHAPVLTVDPGDTVLVRSLDAAGYLARQEFPGDAGQPKMFTGEFRGHCLTGPIAVRGAEPGDMLAVRLVSLRPDEWGWTVAPTVPDSPVARRLELAAAEPAWLLWEIDADAGKATANGKYTRPLAPFLGVTGVAPAGRGEHSTVPPRAETGGNIDCKELVAGSVLYLPVAAPGALLYLYGPYRFDRATAPSNDAFDASLRSRDARWGVRDVRDLEAAASGFTLREVVAMPANNHSLVFARIAP